MAAGMIPAVLATGQFGFKRVLGAGGGRGGGGGEPRLVQPRPYAAVDPARRVGLGNARSPNDREWMIGLFETALGLGFAVGPLLGGPLAG
jgi:MFS transporter, ACDE family, multidrug resistance protein